MMSRPLCAALLGLLLVPDIAAAQAWVAPANTGAITVAAQALTNTGHRDTDGGVIPQGSSVNDRVDVEIDYAFTDRFSLTASLPFVFAKYTDPTAPPPPIPYLPVDSCHCWQTGWQDFGLTARFNVVSGAFAFTPSIAIGVPTHEYNYIGEAMVGQHLKEVRVALDAGQRIDAISPRLSIEGRYTYAFVERVIDIPNNRSNAAIEPSFEVARHLSVRGLLLWQRVHGGLRFGGAPNSALPFPGEIQTAERLREHDRLLRDNFFRAGAAVSYSLPRVDLFASYVHFVSGHDSHTGHAFSAGMSWPFELTR